VARRAGQPRPARRPAAGELAERIGRIGRIGREIIRRRLAASEPELWHHQGVRRSLVAEDGVPAERHS